MWNLNKDRLTIGRDPSADVRIEDPAVSEHHADLLRRGSRWLIQDTGSVNGTFVNGAKILEVALHGGDRIEIGTTELVVRLPESETISGPQPIAYHVDRQVGNVSNVGRDQSNYYTESNLRYIASRRGRARHLIVWGLLLFLVGNGLALAGILSFQGSIFDAINQRTPDPPDIPDWFFPAVSAGSFMILIGVGLFIFGLIARSGAKREARRIGAEWS